MFWISFAALVAIVFCAASELRGDLQMLQQNSYRPSRYWRWLRKNSGQATLDTFLYALMAGIMGGFYFSAWQTYAIAAVGLLALYKGIRRLRRKSKKPLVFTPRAVRLYVVALLVVAAVVVPVAIFLGEWWGASGGMLLTAAAPFVITLAVWILTPVEALINRHYTNDARRILHEMPSLKVVAITGSYGKTSTKHYLARILAEKYSVVMTPGSYNTTLGVVRTIREHLRPYTEVFIVEMGAKQRGDIAEICDLVHPTVGIITAVGEQHLETFGSLENVRRTKFELVDALPADGVAILNNDFEPIATHTVENVGQVIRYATEEGRGADWRVVDVRYGRGETTFAIEGPEGYRSAPIETKLVGRHNLSNLLAAWLAGRALGVGEAEMRYAIGGIEQVEHRLQLRHTPAGITIIDDAFNSNPYGAAAALDVLAGFTEGQRIVVTPGMIELGARQADLNREFGRQMASRCDRAIVVGEYNRAAIVAGLADEGFDLGAIYTARDLADAAAKVREVAQRGDTVLYENDLPDTFR